jgi:uncharacterized damage-inducible protein DinB
MSNVRRVRHQLKLAYHGKAWHGPALKEVLEGVTAAGAAAHSIPGAHSIWEVVLHIAAWHLEATRVLGGLPYQTLEGAADWPPVGDVSDAAWNAALGELERSHSELLAAVAEMSEEKLEEKVPGREFSFDILLHGVVHHDLYHAGQISLLRKAHA